MASPKQLIIDAHAHTKAIGSTTCVIVALSPTEPVLRTSYIGDSGYYIFRPNGAKGLELVFKSEEQQKSFNFPYQIGSEGDSPNESLVFSHEIQSRDIVVVGTDGLIDNMGTSALQKIVERHVSANGVLANPDAVSKEIAEQTFKQSVDK